MRSYHPSEGSATHVLFQGFLRASQEEGVMQ